ncbi:pol, partial [Mucuna pruriens]
MDEPMVIAISIPKSISVALVLHLTESKSDKSLSRPYRLSFYQEQLGQCLDESILYTSDSTYLVRVEMTKNELIKHHNTDIMHLDFHRRHLGHTKTNFEVRQNTTFGMILTFGDSTVIKCNPDVEINSILQFCHSAPGGGHYGSTWTTRKVLECSLYWPAIFRDAYQFVSTCDKCQKAGMAMSRRHEMPQKPILFCEGIDFIGPFLLSKGYSHIFLAVDYVEAIATKTNNAKVVVDFLKSNIFCRFGVPKVLISDQGSHFYNRAMASLLHKYGVMHRIAIAYHP